MFDPAALFRLLAPAASIKQTLPELTLTVNVVNTLGVTIDTERGVLLQAHPDNTGRVRVGGTDTDATHGPILVPGGVLWVGTDNANDIGLWTADAGQKVNGFVI